MTWHLVFQVISFYSHVNVVLLGQNVENMLLKLEAKSKDIGNAFEYLHEMYGKYGFARLSHEQAPERGEAFTAAIDGVSKVRECLQINTVEIEKIGKDFFQGNFKLIDQDQNDMLRMAFMLNRKLITILSVIEIWISARGFDNLSERKYE